MLAGLADGLSAFRAGDSRSTRLPGREHHHCNCHHQLHFYIRFARAEVNVRRNVGWVEAARACGDSDISVAIMRLTTPSRLSAFWIEPNWTAATLMTRMVPGVLQVTEAFCGLRSPFGRAGVSH
jgi:hypothetical protein